MEVNGAVFPKPFVEKPVSAEDHNVYIYYPSSAGGGSQRLFRKVRETSESIWEMREQKERVRSLGMARGSVARAWRLRQCCSPSLSS